MARRPAGGVAHSALADARATGQQEMQVVQGPARPQSLFSIVWRRVDPKPVTQQQVHPATRPTGLQHSMQASRRGLAQVGGTRQCRSAAP